MSRTNASSPFGSDVVSATALDFEDFGTGDIVTFQYWATNAKETLTDVGEVVDTCPGGHDPASVTVKTEGGAARTIYANGRVHANYRTSAVSKWIGHDAKLRVTRTGPEAEQ